MRSCEGGGTCFQKGGTILESRGEEGNNSDATTEGREDRPKRIRKDKPDEGDQGSHKFFFLFSSPCDGRRREKKIQKSVFPIRDGEKESQMGPYDYRLGERSGPHSKNAT